jgi:hypothetical protein
MDRQLTTPGCDPVPLDCRSLGLSFNPLASPMSRDSETPSLTATIENRKIASLTPIPHWDLLIGTAGALARMVGQRSPRRTFLLDESSPCSGRLKISRESLILSRPLHGLRSSLLLSRQ